MLYLDYAREAGEWSPNIHGGRENLEAVQFLQEMNATVYKRVPGAITIAEESTSWPGVTQPTDADGLGFGFKWNMGWMHDTPRLPRSASPVHRTWHHHDLTFSLIYAFSENFVLPISHDEVVHGKGSLLRKMPGDRWQQLANVRAYLAFMWAHPGKQLLFMGAEFGQESRVGRVRASSTGGCSTTPSTAASTGWSATSTRPTSTPPRSGRARTRPSSFEWIDANDAGRNVFSFIRRGWGLDRLARAIWSASPTSRPSRTETSGSGCPAPGEWREVLNTDAGDLQRLRCRQPRLRHRPRGPPRQPAGPRHPGGPTPGHDLAAPRLITCWHSPCPQVAR